MTYLNEDARRYLYGSANVPITEIAWARYWGSGSPVWGGDECGCPDDRCIGHHHGADEPCGCLRALVPDYETMEAEAIAIWESYQAGEAGAIAAGEKWVQERSVDDLTGWAFDIAVDDEAGIAVKTKKHPQWRLLWSAGRADEW